jgi:arsenical pump membrane protein
MALLWWLFRHRIPPRFGQPEPDLPVGHVVTPWAGLCATGLTLTLVALVALGFAGYPLWWTAVTGGVLLGGLAIGSRRMSVNQVAEALSPSILLFVVSMTVVIAAFEREWLGGQIVTLPQNEIGAMVLAMLGNAAGSNVVNNVPMVLLSASIIERSSSHLRDALTYGSLVGANIGPALTTYGSLATILWLTFLRRHGVEICTADYLRVSLVVVPVVLLVTTTTLAVILR